MTAPDHDTACQMPPGSARCTAAEVNPARALELGRPGSWPARPASEAEVRALARWYVATCRHPVPSATDDCDGAPDTTTQRARFFGHPLPTMDEQLQAMLCRLGIPVALEAVQGLTGDQVAAVNFWACCAWLELEGLAHPPVPPTPSELHELAPGAMPGAPTAADTAP
jgi:hypothetical protein